MAQREVSIPFSGQSWGQLRAHGGLRDFSLGPSDAYGLEGSSFVQGIFEGVQPRLRVDGGSVELGYSRWAGFLCRQGGHLELHPDLPWHIEIHGGLSGLHAQLAQLELNALTVHGGVSDVLIELPEPLGYVPISIHGGAERLTLVRPHAAALRIQVHGGLVDAQLDETHLESVGGGLRWQSESDASAGYYDVRILGGASRLVVARQADMGVRTGLRNAWT